MNTPIDKIAKMFFLASCADNYTRCHITNNKAKKANKEVIVVKVIYSKCINKIYKDKNQQLHKEVIDMFFVF